ncbi:MAG: nucleotidyltransferase domain-containing protein [Planctomycetia bacterium]|nr:nucleotidyltransferase domain-containing protein [Planctomycetia bacterium]
MKTISNIQCWLDSFRNRIVETFELRIEFIGIQGSYARNEAHSESDIDVVVILDQLSFDDLKQYKDAISTLSDRKKICGFIAGKDELIHWEKSDLFQFYHDTKPLLGNLDFLRPLIQKNDIRRAISIAGGNIYHACCHNYLHEQEGQILRSLYKVAFFALQARHYIETGVYLGNRHDLRNQLSDQDRQILETADEIPESFSPDQPQFALFSKRLLQWSSQLIRTYSSPN